MPTVIEKMKQLFQTTKADLTRLTTAQKHVKQSVTDLQATLPVIQDVLDVLQVGTEKMNFKNAPRLARIKERQAHINEALAALKKRS
ncbi:hypothetical protein [Weissella soli]|uniref:hypothetical protein n=1 Tax=Weissella soli TaxID=155866 RepID=UPI001F2A2A09|nr:hypothetical protein [Weissella soli]GJM47869.1 hypothetical protein WSSLDB02_04260 [Weissella soli]